MLVWETPKFDNLVNIDLSKKRKTDLSTLLAIAWTVFVLRYWTCERSPSLEEVLRGIFKIKGEWTLGRDSICNLLCEFIIVAAISAVEKCAGYSRIRSTVSLFRIQEANAGFMKSCTQAISMSLAIALISQFYILSSRQFYVPFATFLKIGLSLRDCP